MGLKELDTTEWLSLSLNTCSAEFNSIKFSWTELALLFAPHLLFQLGVSALGNRQRWEAWAMGNLEWIPIRVWGGIEATNRSIGGAMSATTFCLGWGSRVIIPRKCQCTRLYVECVLCGGRRKGQVWVETNLYFHSLEGKKKTVLVVQTSTFGRMSLRGLCREGWGDLRRKMD